MMEFLAKSSGAIKYKNIIELLTSTWIEIQILAGIRISQDSRYTELVSKLSQSYTKISHEKVLA